MSKIMPIIQTPTTTLSPEQIAQALAQTPQIPSEIIAYITKLQIEQQEKYKTKMGFSQTANDSAEKKPPNQFMGLNDNIHIDTDKKSKARRSLLFLLNNLSGGTFCPEINDYFDEFKKMKQNEQQTNNNIIEMDESTKKLTKVSENSNSKNSFLRTKTINEQALSNNDTVNAPKYNFKKRDDIKDNNKQLEDEEMIRRKVFKNDYDMNQLEQLYSREDLQKESQFHFSKEAKAKQKLLKKGDNNKPKKKKKNTIAQILSKSKDKHKNILMTTKQAIQNSTIGNALTNSPFKTKPKKFFDVNVIEEADDSSHSSQRGS